MGLPLPEVQNSCLPCRPSLLIPPSFIGTHSTICSLIHLLTYYSFMHLLIILMFTRLFTDSPLSSLLCLRPALGTEDSGIDQTGFLPFERTLQGPPTAHRKSSQDLASLCSPGVLGVLWGRWGRCGRDGGVVVSTGEAGHREAGLRSPSVGSGLSCRCLVLRPQMACLTLCSTHPGHPRAALALPSTRERGRLGAGALGLGKRRPGNLKVHLPPPNSPCPGVTATGLRPESWRKC